MFDFLPRSKFGDEVVVSEYYSETNYRAAYIHYKGVDYRIEFIDAAGDRYEDWRDTLIEAEEAAEDWVLGE